jgi:DNA-binding LytR/AlgR family response regulator
MQVSYIIIDNNETLTKEILNLFEYFPNYFCAGIVKDNKTIANQITKLKPQLVFIQIPTKSNESKSLFQTIVELFQYTETIPYFVALAKTPDFALQAIQSGFSEYLTEPISMHHLGKSLFKFEKRTPKKWVTSLCIKSYSDYQFVNLEDIVYLKADNNTTDIQLMNGKIINAYKTLKHFENSLPFFFLRIHKSYIVNINHVSRIHVTSFLKASIS